MSDLQVGAINAGNTTQNTRDITIPTEGDTHAKLTNDSFTSSGDTKNKDADLSLVIQSAEKAESWQQDKQWSLLWRDADLLYQSPRPMTVYENTYVLEPNVQRFTVAKVVNSIVPQLYKGLFYESPPMVLRTRPGISQEVVDAKKALHAKFLEDCNFKRETKWGLEHMGLFGTGIFKWGIEYVEIQEANRKANIKKFEVGDQAQGEETVVTNESPTIDIKTRAVARPFFEFRPITSVLVDPHTPVGDIREAKWAIDVRKMDFYELDELRNNLTNDDDSMKEEGWTFPANLKEAWIHDAAAPLAPVQLSNENSAEAKGTVHHSEDMNFESSPDPLRNRLEVLEYWDKKRKIIVLDRKFRLYKGENKFNKLPFLSSNWWNRPKSFYGMGLGLIIGQNQRVDQGTINAVLKMLSFGVNPIYIRKRDANAPNQMIRTGLGKILTVDGELANSYKLLETPEVPQSTWAALQESERATESTSGADQQLVQGSNAGPRSSITRTAGGAAIMASSSATRLDGPLDNFIDQVFTPFLYILDELVFNYVSDKEIMDTLGKELGEELIKDFNIQKFHDAKCEFEVLAGASLSAKRIMAQSLTLITQIFENPQIQENLAEINQEYIDFKPILKMWMESSEWKNVNDIIKPLTDEMKQRMQQKSEAAQAQSKLAVQSQLNDQKFQQKQQIEDQANEGRIKRDIVREAFKHTSTTEAVEGEPGITGLQGSEPEVV